MDAFISNNIVQIKTDDLLIQLHSIEIETYIDICTSMSSSKENAESRNLKFVFNFFCSAVFFDRKQRNIWLFNVILYISYYLASVIIRCVHRDPKRSKTRKATNVQIVVNNTF